MSQEFGEIWFGQFWGRICHKVMVRCQGTLQSLEGLTGCDMQDADPGCWQLVLATEWNLSWDHQPEHLQWPLHITWAFAQPDLQERWGSDVFHGQGPRKQHGSQTALCDYPWNWQHHARHILLVMSKSSKASPVSKEGEADPTSP